MTFVGKILVIVIMCFAVLFLGLSTVVFSTAINWRDKAAELKTANAGLQEKLAEADKKAADATEDLAKAKADHAAQLEQLDNQIKTLEDNRKTAETEITAVKTQLETAAQYAKAALEEAQARVREADTLRTDLQAAQKQANLFKLQQTDLNDRLRVMERDLGVAQDNNKSLRETVSQLTESLRSRGLPTEPTRVSARESGPAPDIEGEVARVDSRGQRAELTIGSDDGLVVGHELYVFRTGATSEYVGKIRIDAVEPDKASGQQTQSYLGRKLQEGDLVAAKIRPRS
jgi:hypothetical protein